MPYVATCWIYAINFLLLALVSPVVKVVFSSGFFQFLGKISYSLFLVGMLMQEWVGMAIMRHLIHDHDWEYVEAVYLTFFIVAPLTILVSWLLADYVDQ